MKISEEYLIEKETGTDVRLFLVDRRITKARWWTYEPKEALKFTDKSKAENHISHALFYKEKIKVTNYDEAVKWRIQRDQLHRKQMAIQIAHNEENGYPFDNCSCQNEK